MSSTRKSAGVRWFSPAEPFCFRHVLVEGVGVPRPGPASRFRFCWRGVGGAAVGAPAGAEARQGASRITLPRGRLQFSVWPE
jgi:hypothetical protein